MWKLEYLLSEDFIAYVAPGLMASVCPRCNVEIPAGTPGLVGFRYGRPSAKALHAACAQSCSQSDIEKILTGRM